MDKNNFVFEDFKDFVGTVFTVSEDEFPRIPLTLSEAELQPARYSRPGARPSFSLMFLCVDERVLPQKIYQLEHDEMGAISLFLVPIGKDQGGILYQALFN